MIILVDQDGPLAQFEAAVLRDFQKLGRAFPGVPVSDRVHEWVADDYPEEYGETIRALYRSEGFYRTLEPVPGAKEALNEMIAAGHKVMICTRPLPKPLQATIGCTLDKLWWIDRHFGPKWVERTIVTFDKTLVFGNVLIDDHPQRGAIRHPFWEQVLYDMPFNRTMNGMRRLDWTNWKEILINKRRS